MSTSSDRVVRNSAFNLTGQGLYAFFHLLSIVVLARALGVAGFGQYYMVFALILVVQLLAEAGLGTILTRRLVQNPADRGRIVSEGASLFGGVALTSVLVLVLIGVAFAWWRGDVTLLWVFLAAGSACAAIQVQRFCAGVFQASELFIYENAARVLQGATFAALVLLLVASGQRQLSGVVSLLAASHWVAAAFLLAMLHRHQGFAWPSRHARWRSWLSEAGPLGAGDVIRGLTWQLDTVLLGFLQPAAVVGLYSVAYRPLGPLNWLPRAVLAASFPSLTRLANDAASLEAAFARSARILTIIAVPVAATIFVFAEPFVLFVAGPDYLEAAVPLRILIWIAVLSFLTMHFRFVMTAIGRQRAYAWLVGGVFALEALLELILIPRWGYLGACAGSLTGEVVFAAAGLALCRHAGIRARQWNLVARAVLAGMAVVAPMWFARDAAPVVVLPLAVTAIGMYFALCVWFGAIQTQEVRQFGGVVVRLLRPAARPI